MLMIFGRYVQYLNVTDNSAMNITIGLQARYASNTTSSPQLLIALPTVNNAIKLSYTKI